MSAGAIAIIPARGGSKRIPRKNVREFFGKPMIAWPIEAARASGLFDRIVVSTDDNAISAAARDFGAEVPFVRPTGLSDDHASTDAVVLHAVRECQRLYGSFSLGCCIYPSPFVLGQDLAAGLELLQAHGAPSAFPVVEYDFPIEQAFALEGVHPRPLWEDKLDMRSQDLPPRFHDAGIFYWFDVVKFGVDPRLFTARAAALVVPRDRCQDINTEADWAAAEFKFGLAGK